MYKRQGLNPGPLLFETNPEFCWSLISSLYIANVFTLAVAVLVIPFLIKILSVPIKYMIPIITCVCIVGAYSTSYSMYGVIVMFISGIVGYILAVSYTHLDVYKRQGWCLSRYRRHLYL